MLDILGAQGPQLQTRAGQEGCANPVQPDSSTHGSSTGSSDHLQLREDIASSQRFHAHGGGCSQPGHRSRGACQLRLLILDLCSLLRGPQLRSQLLISALNVSTASACRCDRYHSMLHALHIPVDSCSSCRSMDSIRLGLGMPAFMHESVDEILQQTILSLHERTGAQHALPT